MSRGHPSRVSRQARGSIRPLIIPDKLYFRIGEVSHLTETKAYVLRYWETEFPTLKPVKSRSGHRLYRRQDLETVFEIKRLLYEQGFTIDGARKQLASLSAGHAEGVSERSNSEKSSATSNLNGQHLRAIQRELQGILTILSGKC